MAIEVIVESTIDRPVDDVFAVIADLERWPTWLIASGIRSIVRDRSGAPVDGERLVVEQDAAGRAGTFDAEVTVYEPGGRLGLRGRDRDGVSIDIEAVVSEAASAGGDDPGTDLRWSIRIGLPLRYRVFESMARPQVERAARLDIEAMRRDLEAGSD